MEITKDHLRTLAKMVSCGGCVFIGDIDKCQLCCNCNFEHLIQYALDNPTPEKDGK